MKPNLYTWGLQFFYLNLLQIHGGLCILKWSPNKLIIIIIISIWSYEIKYTKKTLKLQKKFSSVLCSFEKLLKKDVGHAKNTSAIQFCEKWSLVKIFSFNSQFRKFSFVSSTILFYIKVKNNIESSVMDIVTFCWAKSFIIFHIGTDFTTAFRYFKF